VRTALPLSIVFSLCFRKKQLTKLLQGDQELFNYLRQGFVTPPNSNESELQASVRGTKEQFTKFLAETQLVYGHFLGNDELDQKDVANFVENDSNSARDRLIEQLCHLIKGSATAFLRHSAHNCPNAVEPSGQHRSRRRKNSLADAKEIIAKELQSPNLPAELTDFAQNVGTMNLAPINGANFRPTLNGTKMNGLGSHLSSCFRALVKSLRKLLKEKDESKILSIQVNVKNALADSPLYNNTAKQQLGELAGEAVEAFFNAVGEEFAAELKKSIKELGKGLTSFLPQLSRQLSTELTNMVSTNICEFALRAIQAKRDQDYIDDWSNPERKLGKKIRERIFHSVRLDNYKYEGELQELRDWFAKKWDAALGGRKYQDVQDNDSVMPLMHLYVDLHRCDEDCSDHFDDELQKSTDTLKRRRRYMLLPIGDFSSPPAAFAKGVVLQRGAKAAAALTTREFAAFLGVGDEGKQGACRKLLTALAKRLADSDDLDELCEVIAPDKYVFYRFLSSHGYTRIEQKKVHDRLVNFIRQKRRLAQLRSEEEGCEVKFRVNGFYADGLTANVQGEFVYQTAPTRNQKDKNLLEKAERPLGCSGVDPGKRSIGTLARGLNSSLSHLLTYLSFRFSILYSGYFAIKITIPRLQMQVEGIL
jgi:hypothetical protein